MHMNLSSPNFLPCILHHRRDGPRGPHTQRSNSEVLLRVKGAMRRFGDVLVPMDAPSHATGQMGDSGLGEHIFGYTSGEPLAPISV